jgi:hypothetical protein
MKCKVGRRRKSGERYPSGKLKPRKTLKPDIEPMSPALWQRIRQHGRQLGADPRLETELGRLNLHGELTVAMTVTGFGIGEIYGRYESYNRLSSSPKSPSYNASVGEAGISEDLLLPEQIEDRERRIRNATRAWEQLEAKIPHELRGPIHDLCVSNKHVSPVLYEDIRQLLSRLATEWNMHGAPRESTPPTVNRRHGPPLHFNKHETESRPHDCGNIRWRLCSCEKCKKPWCNCTGAAGDLRKSGYGNEALRPPAVSTPNLQNEPTAFPGLHLQLWSTQAEVRVRSNRCFA